MYICILCCSPQYTAVLAKQEMTIVKHLVFSWSSSGTFFWSLYFIHFDSVPITAKVVSSNPVHGEVYSIQHYVIKFVSDLRQVSDFLRVFRFPPAIKLTAMI